MTKLVPLNDLSRIAKDDLAHISDLAIQVIESGHYVSGPFLKQFEDALANYVGVSGAVGVGKKSPASCPMPVCLGDRFSTIEGERGEKFKESGRPAHCVGSMWAGRPRSLRGGRFGKLVLRSWLWTTRRSPLPRKVAPIAGNDQTRCLGRSSSFSQPSCSITC
jgi:hypothetical protein